MATATVDIRCGFLWLKTKPVKIYRKHDSIFWKFLDTGKFCPGREAECAEDRLTAQHLLDKNK